MPTLKEILQKLVPDLIRKRGFQYFASRSVSNLAIEKNIVTATVKGSKEYDVRIEFNYNKSIADYVCTCPYMESGAACKHIVAVLYQLNFAGVFYPYYEFERPDVKNNNLKLLTLDKTYSQISPLLGEHSEQKKAIDGQTDLMRKRNEWMEEVRKKKEATKLAELRNNFNEFFQEQDPKRQKTKYKIIYGITTAGYCPILYALKVKILKDGTYSSVVDEITTITAQLLEGLSFQERLVLEFFGDKYGKIHLSNTYDYGIYTAKDTERKNALLSDILTFLMEKEVYHLDAYSKFLDKRIYVRPEYSNAAVTITEDDENISLSLKIYFEGEEIKLDKNTFPLINNPLWLFACDKIFRVSNLSRPQLTAFMEKGNKILVPKIYMEYFEQNILPQIVSNLPIEAGKYSVEYIETPPAKKIFMEEYENSLLLKLKFGYGSYDLFYNPSEQRTTFLTDGKIITVIRDKVVEEEARDLIKTFYVKEIEPGFFTPRKNPLDLLFKLIPYAKENGFEIYGDKELSKFKVNASRPKVSLVVSSGVDWFDVETKIDFSGSYVNLETLLSALKQKKNYIELNDGSVGILPEEWIKKFQRTIMFGEADQNSIRFSKAQANALDFLVNEADDAQTDEAFKEHINRLNSFDKIKKQKLPSGINASLRNYQKSGFDWFYFLQEFNFGGILADDMGLGKTIQALALLAKEKKGNRTSLIVAPTSVVFNWINEIKKFTPGLKVLNHTGGERIKGNTDHFENYDAVITSYSVLLREADFFSKIKFYYIILDESQKIKNPLSKTAKAVRMLSAGHKLCLTGTPVENNLNEIWSQFAFLNPGLLGSLNKFQKNFTKPIHKQNDKSASEHLRKLIYPFILRRTKDLVAKELPKKSEVIHYCEMEPEQEKIYNLWRNSIREELMEEISRNGIKKSGFKVIEGLLRLRQICNHPVLVKKDYRKKSGKFEEFKELSEKVIGDGHKVLVFSQFVQMLDILKAYLNRQKIAYEYLTGSVINREERVNNFQNNNDVKIFLISLKAGGFGLNLTAADYVFHYDPWWNPAVEAQATDRTHRIGQDKNIFVYKFITKNTIEEKILLLQERKRKLVENIITSENGMLKNLTREDIEILFG
ncbi:MAG: SNF2-related protein [Ignavibacteriaceae bacterium]